MRHGELPESWTGPEFIPAPPPFPNYFDYFSKVQHRNEPSHYPHGFVRQPPPPQQVPSIMLATPIRVADIPAQPVQTRRPPVLPVAPAHTLSTNAPFKAEPPRPFRPSHAPLFQQFVDQVTSTTTPKAVVDATQFSAKKPQADLAKDEDDDDDDNDDLPPPAALPPSVIASLVG